MSSENDGSIIPETVVSQSEAPVEPVAEPVAEVSAEPVAEAVTVRLVSPVSVPSSARLSSVQSAYAKNIAVECETGPVTVKSQSPSTLALQCAVCVKLQEEADKLVSAIERLVQGGQLTMLNIIEICLSLMTMAEQIPNSTGPQRKQMVLQAVTTYLEKSGGDCNLVNLLPPFIDAAIALEKGDTQIAAEEAVVGCMGCLGFWSAKNSKNSKKGKKSKCGSEKNIPKK